MTGSLNVVVGITGGIAAYKAVGVIRSFVLAGHRVQVVATQGALRFVGRPTLEAISRNPVHTELYEGVAEVRHVAIGQAADLIVIAPATANTIARLASGLADDLLGNTVLASTAPVVIAPAMHTEMWQNPATQANIATLRSRGVTVVGPASGQLTGTDSGPGRMEEPETIVQAALAAVRPAGDLTGTRIVITAGGTREALDPVRFLGNRSSGKQGVALATAAVRRGASVTLIASHLDVTPPDGVTLVSAPSATELQHAVTDAAGAADIIIMAAAVSDYRPAEVRDTKIKKGDTGNELTLRLVQNPDILAGLAASARPDQVIVGFAAETAPAEDELLALGRAKLERKGCDFLVVNRVGWNEGFALDTNTVVVLARGGKLALEASGSKLEVADRILDAVTGHVPAPVA
ncbi:bifunctional phosphopantothenoylcysteine decarboxylase/phosphopantothenate--cysteine ligase CoaBC [Mycetocola sp.]|jgi:phosphopantothenoylcysteine decarboxylase/phosphopantothenate--cysteine ligase|uniref:bifunctional phosphopantothenoylcysteine decarboxylase/phosphopantothenate--cysteine ligase CoaBC n=1 Tax=Mycetocola sp. TaxID=1871042 RepID=UPI00262617A0|nr:bifunctional phosphopantothenoylcysteine decarboxylase/phosphopantothenate--cysteine ligase CoaBC [Mycetocola sp.]MCU1559839.1 coaBC [Mycetocola sp.]